jgi:membrane protein implicated in regulation of membrane protease activity
MSRRKRRVYVHSGLQNAEDDEPLAAGARVIVTAVKGMTVKVKRERGAVW